MYSKVTIFFVAWFLLCSSAIAHELLPAYPELNTSFIKNVMTTKLTLFNKREDVKYYEISVFDEDWNPVEFATTSKILEVEFQKYVSFDIYISNKDTDKILYICTESKLLKQQLTATVISSRICSKVK